MAFVSHFCGVEKPALLGVRLDRTLPKKPCLTIPFATISLKTAARLTYIDLIK